MKTLFLFDFDSTIVTVETLDELLKKALAHHPKKEQLSAEIEAITNAGMNGELDFRESLWRRIQTANIHQEHIDSLASELLRGITKNIPESISLLLAAKHHVAIVSGGFRELIFPVADHLCIPREYCFANDFEKKDNIVTGIDDTNPLSKSGGKSVIAEQLRRENAVEHLVMIGDGMSDAEPFLHGIANEFWGFFGNVRRPKVEKKATHTFFSGAELLQFVKENQ